MWFSKGVNAELEDIINKIACMQLIIEKIEYKVSKITDKLDIVVDDVAEIKDKTETLTAHEPNVELAHVRSQLDSANEFIKQLLLKLVEAKINQPDLTISDSKANYLARRNGSGMAGPVNKLPG